MPRHDTIRNGLSPDENLPHGQILAIGTDKPAKLYSSTQR